MYWLILIIAHFCENFRFFQFSEFRIQNPLQKFIFLNFPSFQLISHKILIHLTLIMKGIHQIWFSEDSESHVKSRGILNPSKKLKVGNQGVMGVNQRRISRWERWWYWEFVKMKDSKDSGDSEDFKIQIFRKFWVRACGIWNCAEFNGEKQ